LPDRAEKLFKKFEWDEGKKWRVAVQVMCPVTPAPQEDTNSGIKRVRPIFKDVLNKVKRLDN
jgi:hypothetical protein